MAQSTGVKDELLETMQKFISRQQNVASTFSIRQPPPLDINSSNLAEEWRRWRCGYTTYFQLCDGNQLPEHRQVALLLSALGEAANSMYYDMDWEREEDKLKHDVVLQRFG